MRIRTLVPALACLAAAPLATAADGPAVKFDGFVDSILSGSSLIDSDPEDKESNSEFSYAAKLGVNAAISEKVSAQVDFFVNGNSTSAVDANGDAASGNEIIVRQAYGTWKIADDVELKTGKFISNYGWIAAYAPGLYRVNAGPITQFYGVDQVGADVKWSKDALTAAVTVANGFFGEGDNGAQSAVGQKDQAYAIGLDVVYALGSNGSVNFEAIYDIDAGAAAGGSDGMHLAANATLTPNEQVTAGLEAIFQTVGTADDAPDTQDDIQHLGLMGLVNYKLGSAMAIPASVTGSIQYIDIGNVGFTKDSDESEIELAVALLTNPAGTDKLGANFEIYYATGETDDGTTKTEGSEVGVAAELLYVF